jgi:hypothetical protein
MSLQEEIKSILENFKTMAIVGLSHDPAKDSFNIAQYLKSKGYRIIPITPSVEEVLGEKCYKSLLDIPEDLKKTIEVVDIFRSSQDIPPVVDQVIQLRKKYGNPYVIWMQLGIVNEEAAKQACKAGLKVVMDRCIMIEHRRVEQEDRELGKIHAKKLQELKIRMSEKNISKGKEDSANLITLDDAHFDEIVNQQPIMLIDCWAAWCGPCRLIAPVIDELARDYAGHIIVAKLNVDENPEIATRFNIMTIPTVLIMKFGKEVDRIIGAVPKQFIEERLKGQM